MDDDEVSDNESGPSCNRKILKRTVIIEEKEEEESDDASISSCKRKKFKKKAPLEEELAKVDDPNDESEESDLSAHESNDDAKSKEESDLSAHESNDDAKSKEESDADSEDEAVKNKQEKKNKQKNPRIREFNYGPSTSAVNELNDDDPLVLCRSKGNGRVRLCEVYNVWIDKADLTYIQRWLHNPKEMSRRLMKILIGTENLKGMCARGNSRNHAPIPADILRCVEYYVNKKCLYRLLPSEFTNVINFMCGTLRNPKKK